MYGVLSYARFSGVKIEIMITAGGDLVFCCTERRSSDLVGFSWDTKCSLCKSNEHADSA